MARRLTNLQISEISSCERGAAGDRDGRGKASVLLLKRDDSGERVTLADIAKARLRRLAASFSSRSAPPKEGARPCRT
jgi:hypothetical protein